MNTIWDHRGLDLVPVATAVGPFTTPGFLSAVGRLDRGEPLAASRSDAFLALQRDGDWIRFAGDPDYTDYHSPLGEGTARLIAEVAEQERPGGFLLDSLPIEAVAPLEEGLGVAGWKVERRAHEVTAVLDLPASYDDYLASIGKKERHEVRRKRRRYERLVGEVEFETHHGRGWALEEFVRLHRLADGAKGSFMSPEREAFFGDLAETEGWRIDLLRLPEGEAAAACVFGYVDADGYFLYNSSFDPELAPASPGMVLLGEMISRAIAEGRARFDFLKGDETYKFRLGAHRRDLYELKARVS